MAKVQIKLQKCKLFRLFSLTCNFYIKFNISQLVDFQYVTKKLQKPTKKNQKKCIFVLKKYVPLHRFNK